MLRIRASPSAGEPDRVAFLNPPAGRSPPKEHRPRAGWANARGLGSGIVRGKAGTAAMNHDPAALCPIGQAADHSPRTELWSGTGWTIVPTPPGCGSLAVRASAGAGALEGSPDSLSLGADRCPPPCNGEGLHDLQAASGLGVGVGYC